MFEKNKYTCVMIDSTNVYTLTTIPKKTKCRNSGNLPLELTMNDSTYRLSRVHSDKDMLYYREISSIN